MINRQQIEWVTFAVASISVGIISFISLNQDIKRAIDSEHSRLEYTAKMFSTDIELTLQSVDLALKGINRNNPTPFYYASQSSLLQNLQSVSDAMPGVRGINVVNRNGIISASYPKDIIGKDASRRYFYTAPKNFPNPDNLYVSPPYISVYNDKVVSITRFIPDEKGFFNGSVSAILDPDYFNIRIHSILFESDVKAWISDLAHSNFVETPSLESKERISDNWLNHIFSHQFKKSITVENIVKISENKDGHGLIVGISRDSRSVVSPILIKAKLYTFFLIFLFIFCSGFLLAHQLRRKNKLADRTKKDFENAHSEALRLSESRFRALIEEAPVAIAILREGRFLYSNSRYCKLHNYSCSDQLKGLFWKDLIASYDVKHLKSEVAHIEHDSPIELQFEAKSLGNNNDSVPMLISTARVHVYDGDLTLIFAQDMSAQKKAELQALEARDAAEAANQSKAEFLANMSHEIRTPLNAILGFNYLLEQSNLSDDANLLVKNIRIASRSLLGIINDILDMSKIDAGAMVIESASLNLQELIDNVATIMGGASLDRPVQLIVHPLPLGIYNIIGDALRLEQILINLTNNAIKFTLEGYVELSVHIHTLPDEKNVLKFLVVDTGIGIPETLKKTIFRPFSQADTSTTRRFGGSGLGLTICKKLVEMMGGEIGVNSNSTTGSVFWFTVPLMIASEKEIYCYESTSVDAVMSSNDSKLLTNFGLIGTALGWNVSLFDSTQSVIEEILKCQNDNEKESHLKKVIFMDWNNNKEECLALAYTMQKVSPSTQFPIVIVTSASTESQYSEIIRENFSASVLMPATISTMNNAAVLALRKFSKDGKRNSNNIFCGQELRGIQILVVDDSEINRDVAQRILRRHGAEVYLAEDGKKAIGWLLSNPKNIDLVLMDLQMPVMDGIEATRQLRNIARFSRLPIVALTAGAFKSHYDAAREAGMTHFIAKPFDVKLTIDLIVELAGRRNIEKSDNPAGTAELSTLPSMVTPAIIDIERGVEIWGDFKTFVDYLGKFVNDFSSDGKIMKKYALEGDYLNASKVAHKLTGVAASLALIDLAETARDAEYAFIDTEDNLKKIIDCSDKVAESLVKVIFSAQELFKNSAN